MSLHGVEPETGRPGRPSYYRARLPRATWAPDRDRLLADLARGERVLHIGCADAPLTAGKLRDGTLLHAALLDVCDEIVGVDIDADGLAQLESALGGRYVQADATDSAALVAVARELGPTVILAADVIEHIGNHVSFLDAVAVAAGQSEPAARLVLSTPNGLSARSPVLAWAGCELVHPDHYAVFTPTTLARSLTDTGFRPVAWHTYSVSLGRALHRRAFDAVAHTVGRARPLLADGLLVVAQLDPVA